MRLSSQNPGTPSHTLYCSITKYETNYKLGSALQTQSIQGGVFFLFIILLEYKHLFHNLLFGFSSRHTDWFDK